MKPSSLILQIPGKADSSGSSWLPLWMHSRDTAGIIIRLLNDWLPEHTFNISGISIAELQKVCRFLALVHDIGKLTPVFAGKICALFPELRSRLESGGLSVGSPKDYEDGKTSPHARAGEIVLLSLGCPEGVAAVVGAHHGKPQDSILRWQDELDKNEKNYFGLEYKKSGSGRIWEAIRREWFSVALEEAGYSSPADIPAIRPPVQVLLTGLLIMADWIASNTDYFPLISAGVIPCTFMARFIARLFSPHTRG